jgi:hypothetical protein
MNHLIQPFYVSGISNIDSDAYLITHTAGDLKCCNASTRLTDANLEGDARADADGRTFHFLETPTIGEAGISVDGETDRVYSGAAVIGVCCATGIKLEMTGQMETLNDDYDGIFINFSDGYSTFYNSFETYDGLDDSTTNGTFTVTENIPISTSPCGFVISICASTRDEIANNDIYWSVKITPT